MLIPLALALLAPAPLSPLAGGPLSPELHRQSTPPGRTTDAPAVPVELPAKTDRLSETLDALSPGSIGLVALGDTRSLLASENPGALLGVLSADNVLETVRELMGSFEGIRADAVDRVLATLKITHGGVVSIGVEGGSVFGALWGEGELEASLVAAMEGFGLEFEEGTCGERNALVAFDETGLAWAVSQESGYVIMAYGEEDVFGRTMDQFGGQLKTMGRAPLAEVSAEVTAEVTGGEAVAGGPVKEPKEWWRKVDQRVDEPFIEGFMDVAAFAEGDDLNLQRLASLVPFAYTGLTPLAGKGDASLIALQFAEHEAIEGLVEALKIVPGASISLAPKDTAQANYLSFVPEKIVGAIDGLVAVFAPEGEGVLIQQFSMVSDLVGVDVPKEVLPALTGDFMMFEFAAQTAALEMADEDELENLSGEIFPTFGLGVIDREPIQQFVDGIFGLGLLAEDDVIETEEATEWIFGAEAGFPTSVVLTEALLTVGPTACAKDLQARAKLGGEGRLASGLFDAKGLKEARAHANGFGFGVQETKGMMEAAGLIIDGLRAEFGSEEQAVLTADALSAAFDLFAASLPNRSLVQFEMTAKRFTMRSTMH